MFFSVSGCPLYPSTILPAPAAQGDRSAIFCLRRRGLRGPGACERPPCPGVLARRPGWYRRAVREAVLPGHVRWPRDDTSSPCAESPRAPACSRSWPGLPPSRPGQGSSPRIYDPQSSEDHSWPTTGRSAHVDREFSRQVQRIAVSRWTHAHKPDRHFPRTRCLMPRCIPHRA